MLIGARITTNAAALKAHATPSSFQGPHRRCFPRVEVRSFVALTGTSGVGVSVMSGMPRQLSSRRKRLQHRFEGVAE